MAGAQVFGAKGCSKCHSVNGVGGKVGPDLAKISRPRTFYDLAADDVEPSPADDGQDASSSASPARGWTREKPADLVGFLFTLNYFDSPGNAEAGRKLFTEKNCVVCHTSTARGAWWGPNLDHLTQFRSPIYVAAAMWNHGPQMAETMKEKGIERPTFTAARAARSDRVPGAGDGRAPGRPASTRCPAARRPGVSSSRRSAASSATRWVGWAAGGAGPGRSAACARAPSSSPPRSGTRRRPWRRR